LEKVPNARLIVAGANHHTKAGYWESIREAQPANLPIEFRGYVPEEDIPELFRTTSVLVLPYDSATGSSGPAHQACEYGVPIVCADINDFRDMAADEDMAVSFYKIGDEDALAKQLITILESSELQRHMSERNFAAGLEMTMTNVVGNYLRWFELNQYKRATQEDTSLIARCRSWFRSLFLGGTLHSGSLNKVADDSQGRNPAGSNAQSIDFADPLA
jgi:glycosyltransferase involved in cell wall biosynthesis